MKIVRCDPKNLRPNDIVLRRNESGRYEILGTVVKLPEIVDSPPIEAILVQLSQMSMHIEGDNTLSEPLTSYIVFQPQRSNETGQIETDWAYVLRKDMYWGAREYELQLRDLPPQAFRQLYEGRFFSPEVKTERGRYTPPKTNKSQE